MAAGCGMVDWREPEGVGPWRVRRGARARGEEVRILPDPVCVSAPGVWAVLLSTLPTAIPRRGGLAVYSAPVHSFGPVPRPLRAPPPASPLSFVGRDFFQRKEAFGIYVLRLKFLSSHRLKGSGML